MISLGRYRKYVMLLVLVIAACSKVQSPATSNSSVSMILRDAIPASTPIGNITFNYAGSVTVNLDRYDEVTFTTPSSVAKIRLNSTELGSFRGAEGSNTSAAPIPTNSGVYNAGEVCNTDGQGAFDNQAATTNPVNCNFTSPANFSSPWVNLAQGDYALLQGTNGKYFMVRFASGSCRYQGNCGASTGTPFPDSQSSNSLTIWWWSTESVSGNSSATAVPTTMSQVPNVIGVNPSNATTSTLKFGKASTFTLDAENFDSVLFQGAEGSAFAQLSPQPSAVLTNSTPNAYYDSATTDCGQNLGNLNSKVTCATDLRQLVFSSVFKYITYTAHSNSNPYLLLHGTNNQYVLIQSVSYVIPSAGKPSVTITWRSTDPDMTASSFVSSGVTYGQNPANQNQTTFNFKSHGQINVNFTSDCTQIAGVNAGAIYLQNTDSANNPLGNAAFNFNGAFWGSHFSTNMTPGGSVVSGAQNYCHTAEFNPITNTFKNWFDQVAAFTSQVSSPADWIYSRFNPTGSTCTGGDDNLSCTVDMTQFSFSNIQRQIFEGDYVWVKGTNNQMWLLRLTQMNHMPDCGVPVCTGGTWNQMTTMLVDWWSLDNTTQVIQALPTTTTTPPTIVQSSTLMHYYYVTANVTGMPANSKMQLVLRNGDAINVSQDGSYIFKVPVPGDNGYIVWEYTSAGLSCPITPSSGALSVNDPDGGFHIQFNGGAPSSNQTLTIQCVADQANPGYKSIDNIYSQTAASTPVNESGQPSDDRNGCGTSGPNSQCTVHGLLSNLANGQSIVLQNSLTGDTLTANSNGYFSFGTQVPVFSNYNIVISQQPTGQVCALSNGSGTVTGTVDPETNSLTSISSLPAITVTCKNIFSITADNTSAPLGRTIQLTFIYTDPQSGSSTDVTKTGQWSSSNSSIATVDSNGLVTGVSPGVVTIKGAYNGGSTTIPLTIQPAAPVQLIISAITDSVQAGAAIVLNAIVTLTNGVQQAVTASVTWLANLVSGGNSHATISTNSGNNTASLNANASESINVSATYAGLTSNLIPMTFYSVGGTVHGLLAGNTITLVLNGTVTTTITQGSGSGDLTYRFGVPIIANTVYSVTISSNPGYETCTVSSNGAGTLTASINNIDITCTYPILSVSPSLLSFGSQTVTTSAPAGSMTFSNIGNADLSISGLAIAGPNGGNFNNGVTTCTAILKAGMSCVFSMQFTPTKVGPIAANVYLASAVGTFYYPITGTGVSPPAPVLSNSSISVNVLGVAASVGTATVQGTDPTNIPLTYTIKSQPSEGTVTIGSSTGNLVYTINGYPSSTSVTSDSFVITASNRFTSTDATVSVALNTDPLLQYQWHIQNTGQSAFSTILPVAGNDMNVTGAWQLGLTGKGIKVGVVDTGLEVNHEDLKANVDVAHSYNFLTSTSDPTPSVAGEDHGTQVAGIIAAVAFNGKGGRGIAYNSTLRGYNLLANGANSLANETKALGGDPVSSDNDIFNQSFGDNGTSSAWPGSQLQQFSNALGAINANFTTLRSGLGAVAIHSAGNEFFAWENDTTNRTYCVYANQFGVSCGDAASDTRRASPIPIVVGALDSTGKRAAYSTTGSSLWVSAYGGEYGRDTSVYDITKVLSYLQPYASLPAIVTTALTGCSNYSTAYNSLDNPTTPNGLAKNCQYTAIMNGTSSAAPNTSAVVALMLEANPKLSYRDVKYIIASTATKVDANMAPISIGGLVAEQGWVKNAAGFSFNNWYGFGAINAAAAVSMAKSYTQYLPAALSTSAPYNIASDYTLAAGAGVNFPFNANPSNMTVVEGVLVYFNINEPAGYGLYCIQIEVVSPSGTKSILLHAATGFTNLSVVDSRLESNAFYGEPINGAWKVTVWNQCTAAAVLPSPSPITLYLTGH